MPLWGVQCGNRKKHLSNKSTYTLQHETHDLQQGRGEWGVEVIQPRQAAILLQPVTAQVSGPLVRLGVQSGEGVGWG